MSHPGGGPCPARRRHASSGRPRGESRRQDHGQGTHAGRVCAGRGARPGPGRGSPLARRRRAPGREPGGPDMMAAVETARPLAGRLVVVTRAKAQAASFVALLEAAGARVLVAPTIAIEPPPSWAPLDAALRRGGEYDWAVFTSVNGVEMVKARLSALGLDAGALGRCRVAAIGPATAEALSSVGLPATVVPEEYVAEGLARALATLVRPGQRVLLARAAEARGEERRRHQPCRRPCTDPVDSASCRSCARWSARPTSRWMISSTRSSWPMAAECASPSAPCRGRAASRWTSC